jgi:hypothetical protein
LLFVMLDLHLQETVHVRQHRLWIFICKKQHCPSPKSAMVLRNLLAKDDFSYLPCRPLRVTLPCICGCTTIILLQLLPCCTKSNSHIIVHILGLVGKKKLQILLICISC